MRCNRGPAVWTGRFLGGPSGDSAKSRARTFPAGGTPVTSVTPDIAGAAEDSAKVGAGGGKTLSSANQSPREAGGRACPGDTGTAQTGGSEADRETGGDGGPSEGGRCARAEGPGPAY